VFGDRTPDRLIEAMRVVLASRANAELADLWADGTTEYPAVAKTIGRPVIRSNIQNESLPLLSIVRRSTRFDWQGKLRARRSSIVLEYIGPRTAHEHLDTRWPMLHPVFEAFHGALDGMVPNLDTEVLSAAGVIDIPEESVRVDFNFYDLAGGAYPFFQMQFDVRHTSDGLPAWDFVRNLPYLRELFARYIDGRPADEQPALSTLTRTDVGSAIELASDDPFDDDFAEDP
jgi:hypothetical protein